MKFLVFEKLKAVVTHICNQLGLVKVSTNGRPQKISTIDSITLSLYKNQSTRSTKKSVYEDFKTKLKCSYKTLVVSMNAAAGKIARILFWLMRQNRKSQHVVKYTDATDIPVCLKKNADDHKTMADFAEIARSSKGWYYGIKLTITRDKEGKLLAILFTRAGANDREICKRINEDIYGVIVLDAGYVSKDLEKSMNIDHKRWLLIRPYKSMKKLMTKWQEDLYRGRFSIEFDFRNLKLFHGLVTSLPRSVNGYMHNYLSALLSFVLAPVTTK
jgi:Transposase DDE domain